MHLQAPEAVLAITRRLEEAGFATWAVGGAVRDAVLGRVSPDWDLATAARPPQVRGLFRRTVPVGIDHGTVGVLGRDGVLYEVTTFRRDIETFGRHAVVQFADDLDEDLARRDFTFNAIAWHPLRQELHDPFGGVADLEAGRLRTVGAPEQRFAEDYLRVLRALRFAGLLGLAIDRNTWGALVAAAAQLPALSAERVREELMKVLGQPLASASLSLYAASAVLDVLYPELAALVGLEQGTGHAHDAWTESVLAVDQAAVARPTIRLAALFHGLGKPGSRTRDLRGAWRIVGHEPAGASATEELLLRLRASNAEIARVAALVRLQSDLFPPDAPPAGVRRWLRHVGAARVNDLFRLRIALSRGNPAVSGEVAMRDLVQRWRAAHRELATKPPLAVTDLAIGGDELKQLGLAPGPRYGRILRQLLERVTDEPSLNTQAALLELVRRELNP
jgi:tRNA nucleotidyltransferase (CCA-adding enzyme)